MIYLYIFSLFLSFLVIPHPVQNMSFLPKGTEGYRQNPYTNSFQGIKDIPNLDNNNNTHPNDNNVSNGKFSPKSSSEQIFKPFLEQKPFLDQKPFDQKPFDSKVFDTKSFEHQKPMFNNNNNNNNNNEDNMNQSFQKDAMLLPNTYSSNNNTPTMTSMQTALSSPSSITSNMSRSFSSSSYGKQESDEELDDGGKYLNIFLRLKLYF